MFTKNKHLELVLHILLGFLAGVSSYIWPLVIYPLLFYTFLHLTQTRNVDGWAHKAAAYLAASDGVSRMTTTFIPYEGGKYGVILCLLAGLVFTTKRKPITILPILFFALLIPSLLISHYPDFSIGRKVVSFYMSGPLCLAVSLLYFHNRKITKIELTDILYCALLPLIMTVSSVIIRLPSLSEVSFTSQSNFDTSGGFGPNQISVLLGCGIGLLFLGWILKLKIFKTTLTDLLLLLVTFIFCLITFSRGGFVTAILVSVAALFVSLRHSTTGENLKSIRNIIFYTAILSFGFVTLDTFTGNKLSLRYKETIYGKNYKSHKNQDIKLESSGRDIIIKEEIAAFKSSPVLGLGPGVVVPGIRTHASHTEMTRLIADHGIYGFLALLLLIITPIRRFFKVSSITKVVLVVCVGLALINMTHAAMRVAILAFVYGLGFVKIVDEEVTLDNTMNTQYSLLRR